MDKILFWQPTVYPTPSPFIWIFFNYLPWIFLILGFLLLFFQKSRLSAFFFLFSLALAELFENFLKATLSPWRRPFLDQALPTPPALLSSHYSGGSFPSGHALKLTLLFIFLLALFRPSRPLRFLLFFLLFPFLFFRVITGLHYPVDILAGLALGLLFGYIGLILYRFIISRLSKK